jgi:hypothetical protein
MEPTLFNNIQPEEEEFINIKDITYTYNVTYSLVEGACAKVKHNFVLFHKEEVAYSFSCETLPYTYNEDGLTVEVLSPQDVVIYLMRKQANITPIYESDSESSV